MKKPEVIAWAIDIFMYAVVIALAIFAMNMARSVDAWIYKHKENGSIIYCDSDQIAPRDFTFLGTSKMPNNVVDHCSLAQ